MTTNKNADLIKRLHELRDEQMKIAHDRDMDPKQTANWEYAETCGLAIEALKIRPIGSAAVPGYAHFDDDGRIPHPPEQASAKPLPEIVIKRLLEDNNLHFGKYAVKLIRVVEAAHGIKEQS